MRRVACSDEILELQPIPGAVRLTSSEFEKWIKHGYNFSFVSGSGSVSLLCDSRGYYTASKKVDGNLRRKRVGKFPSDIRRGLIGATEILCDNARWLKYQEEQRAKRKPKQSEQEETIASLREFIQKQKQTIQELKQRNTDLAIELAQYKYADEDDF